MKKIMMAILISLILLTGLYIWLAGPSAIPGNVKIIQSQKTVYGKAVLFEDIDNQTFGVARLELYWWFFYRYDGGSYGHYVEEDKPFEVTGIGTNDKIDSLAIGVKVSSGSGIKYVAVGNYMEDVAPYESYELHLDEVRKNPNDYQLKEVEDDYALFVVDEYTDDTWTIRGFDESGDLIADKRAWGEPRYLK